MSRAVTYRLDRTAPQPVRAPVLDRGQRAVVEHAGGPLLVLAGPGTGKTTTLVECVVSRVERGASPQRLLVLTFSRRAAAELRARITGRLKRTITEPAAFTFHSWCYAVIRAYDVPLGADPPRLLSGPERDVRVHELLVGNAAGEGRTNWPAHLRHALGLRGFAREVADMLDRARERGLDADGLRRLGETTGQRSWVAAGEFMAEYLDVLSARGELDYAGLVRRAIDLLRRPDVGEAIAGRYDAVFVDEYQDTDPSQEDLLHLLAGGGRDLVVVGDPDQSIYAFRGADVGCLLRFPDRFRRADGSSAPIRVLGVCRRLGAELLAPARAIAARLPVTGLPAAVRAAHRTAEVVGPAPTAAPEVLLFPTTAEQAVAIADLLRRAHLHDGVSWSDMAVLVRSGVRSIPVLRRALATAGVPVTVATDELPLAEEPAVQPLLAALGLADAGWRGLTNELARQLLCSPLGRASTTELRALGRRLRALERERAGHARPSAELIREALADPSLLGPDDNRIAAPVRRVHRLVAAAAQVLAAGGSPEQALWEIWDGSGWPRRLLSTADGGGALGRAAERDLDAVLALFSAAARLEEREPRAGVATLLDELESQQIPAAPNEERGTARGAVRLLTAHRAKGLEWEVVVVADVQDGVWPDLRRRGSLLQAELVDADGPRLPPTPATLLAEERRLFYVALTRARRRLTITAVSSLDDAGERPSRFLAETGLAVPDVTTAATALLSTSSLVARLRRTLVDGEAGEELRRAAAAVLAELAAARGDDGSLLVPAADPDSWWGTRELTPGVNPVRDPARPLTVSASAVADYQRCPLRMFLDREVKARGAPATAATLGSVVHAVIEMVGRGELPAELASLEAKLDELWPALSFEAPWVGDRERAVAGEALARFLAWRESTDRKLVGSEARFSVSWGEEAVLSGSVDRLEVDDDGRVRIVDLKTAKSAPTAADVREDPQLATYQLACRAGGFAHLIDGPAELGGAELVFLRLGKGGPTVREQPALPGGPCYADELVDSVVRGLRTESFAARPGEYCQRCPYQVCCPGQDAGQELLQ